MRIAQLGFGVERRRVRGMLLGPAEFGEPHWRVLKEWIEVSRVTVDLSAKPQDAPRSITAARLYDSGNGATESLWMQLIPLPLPCQAEALSVTLLDRIQPNPNRKVTVLSERKIEGLELRGTTNVDAVEKEIEGLGRTGRNVCIVGVVESVAFGVYYSCLGDGWSQDRFVGVAQLQADKIRNKSRVNRIAAH